MKWEEEAAQGFTSLEQVINPFIYIYPFESIAAVKASPRKVKFQTYNMPLQTYHIGHFDFFESAQYDHQYAKNNLITQLNNLGKTNASDFRKVNYKEGNRFVDWVVALIGMTILFYIMEKYSSILLGIGFCLLYLLIYFTSRYVIVNNFRKASDKDFLKAYNKLLTDTARTVGYQVQQNKIIWTDDPSQFKEFSKALVAKLEEGDGLARTNFYKIKFLMDKAKCLYTLKQFDQLNQLLVDMHSPELLKNNDATSLIIAIKQMAYYFDKKTL
ncbi:hypothetical protein ACVRZD_00505 [Streptococcus hongkongensis]|nr:hypothetical protein NC01_00510 [Streptococcus uberis]